MKYIKKEVLERDELDRLINEGMIGWRSDRDRYLKKFEGLDHTDIANKLIKAGNGWAVIENFEKFNFPSI